MTESKLLVSNEDYLKSGIHIGTKFKNKYMEEFIYKTRQDGLSVLDIPSIDERIMYAANLLSQYSPEDILVVCRRENGWKPVKLMSKLTDIKVYAGRYPPGMMTNTQLKIYSEPKIMLIVDGWPDRNAVKDALKAGVVIIALSDTNNTPNNVDLMIPCNNKGKKSLGLIFWLLTKLYLELTGKLNKGQAWEYKIEDFTEE